MKYQCTIEIDKPIAEVIEKMQDPDAMQYWMEGFLRMEPMYGNPGTEGAKANIYFLNRGKEFVLLETILIMNLPQNMKLQYEGKGVRNTVEMFFQSIGEKNTRIVSENEFFFTGAMKYFAWMMKSMFKKQSMKYLIAFKAYVEEGASVS